MLSLSGGLADSGDISVGMLNCGPPPLQGLSLSPGDGRREGRPRGGGVAEVCTTLGFVEPTLGQQALGISKTP